MRSIGVVTSGRADYGALYPVLHAIQADRSLQLKLFVTGTHVSPLFGETVRLIEADGFPIAARVDIELRSDAPAGIAHSMSRAIGGFAEVFERDRPDVLLVVGDRFEILAVVAAALPFNIPVGHISGGEVTEGAIDDSIRHAVTKMSHLHFAAAEPYRTRLLQLGEEPWRIHVTGEPTLDKLSDMRFLSRGELEKIIGMPLEPAPLLVTFHPETLDVANTVRHAEELLAALAGAGRPIVFTAPNADTSGRRIRTAIERFVSGHADARLVVNLGNQAYFSLMKVAGAMVGNSSSGIIEAASFELPVVDVGDREKGRLHGKNVLHAPAERRAITRALKAALQPKFRARLRKMRNPYGSGGSAAKIVRVLKSVPLDAKLLRKRFQDRKPARSR